MALLLGVDGGNTKTVALVARSDGVVVGAGRSGCSDIANAESEDAAFDELERAVNAALREAGASRRDLAFSQFCMAGSDWPEDAAFIGQALAKRGFNSFAVDNDALGALRAGSEDGTGIVLACGTGVATGARNADGRWWFSGFWQCADPLGAAELGRRMLRAIYSAELGMAQDAGPLAVAAMAHFEVGSVEALLRLHYDRAAPLSVGGLSALAPLVFDAAAAGHGPSRAMIDEFGASLAAFAGIAARRVGLAIEKAPIVAAGGLFRHQSRLLSLCLAEHLGIAPERVILTRREPAFGALLIAFERADIAVTGDIISRLDGSHLPASIFTTWRATADSTPYTTSNVA